MKAWYSKVRDTELKDGSVRATYVVTFETDNAELKREVEKYLQGIMDKDEPQTDYVDFAGRLAYERGVEHAWEVAQKVFDSTVTFYEAEDVAKQIDKDINVRSKDEPQTETKTETQNSNLTFEKDECAKEYEELGLKELKELIEADRKTEPTISKMEQVEDKTKTQMKTQNSNLTFEKAEEPQTEDFKACVEGLTLLWIYNYVTDDEFHRIDARLKCKDEPQTENLFTDKDGDVWEWRGDAWYCISGDESQTEQVGVPFGEMDEATFKEHCLNCQRDTADIKCLDCDGNKYFLPYGSKTDCAWR